MTNTRTVVSFDPGITTGFIEASVEYNGRHMALPTITAAMEIPWGDRFVVLTHVFNLLDKMTIDQVIIESFNLYPHAAKHKIGSSFDEIRMIGAIETFCVQHGLGDVLLWQTPGQGKSVKKFPKAWLEGGWSSSPHVLDAMRHLRYWYIMRGKGHTPEGGYWKHLKSASE